jgi:hypothetical protein
LISLQEKGNLGLFLSKKQNKYSKKPKPNTLPSETINAKAKKRNAFPHSHAEKKTFQPSYVKHDIHHDTTTLL